MYGGQERCIWGFGGETYVKETTWKTQAQLGGQYQNGDARSGIGGHGLDCSGSEQGQVAGACEQCDEHLGYIK